MKKMIAIAVVVAACAAIAFIALRSRSTHPAQPVPIDYSTTLLTKPYQNDQFKFSLSMPGNFSARELAPADDSVNTTILLEDVSRSDGVQIIVSPFDEDLHTLTAARIKQDVPDLLIMDPQPIEIGANDTGLAFKSDNDAFGGASREVWFVFRGNLYQISTYDRLDPLLKKIFATWKFL